MPARSATRLADSFRRSRAKRSREPKNFDLKAFVEASKDLSGAEIEEAIISALYDAFYAKQELATAHVLATLAQTVPLAKTMSDHGFDITFARIGTERGVAIDTFYIENANHEPVENPERLHALRDALNEVITPAPVPATAGS